MFWRSNFCSTRRLTQSKFIFVGTLIICLLFFFKYKSLQDDNNYHHPHHIQRADAQHRPRPASAAVASNRPHPSPPGSIAADAQTNGGLNVGDGIGDGGGVGIETADKPAAYNATYDPDRFEALVLDELAGQVARLGDNGKEVRLEGAAKARGDAQMLTIALNEEVSRTLSYNRTLQDVRNPLCRDLNYDLDALPTASVVIIFFNEPYSVLLRTVHSVINNSDRRVLKEIILVDDFSDEEPLMGQLDHYVRTRVPDLVKIVRLKSR